MKRITLESGRKITDCKGNTCEKCTICKYSMFVDWAESVSFPGSTIDYDRELEAYIDSKKHYETT